MPAVEIVPVLGAVEGSLDEAVLLRVVEHVGAFPGPIHGKKGKLALLRRLQGYNRAARHARWVVLIDLDNDEECAPPFRDRHMPEPAAGMCFRVVVREVEAWLLGDRKHIAKYLSVPLSRVPHRPDEIPDPKRFMVDLAARSRRRDIFEDMVPRPGSGRAVGSAYTSRMIEFVSDETAGWRPDIAAESSDSFSRFLARLHELVATGE